MSTVKTPLDQKRLDELKKKYFKLDESKKQVGPGGGPRNSGMMPGGKPKASKATIFRLLGYLKNDKGLIIIAIVSALLGTASSLAASYVLRPVINGLKDTFLDWSQAAACDRDAIFAAGMKTLLAQLGLMLAIYAVGTIASFMQQKIMIKVSQKTLKGLRSELFEKLQKLPVRFYDSNSHGELMSRFTNDVDTIGEMITNTVISFVTGIITLIGSLVLMIITSWILTLVTLVTIPVMIFAVSIISKHSRKYFSAQQASVGAMNGYIEEMVSGQRVVKVYCHEDKAMEQFAALNEELRSSVYNANKIGNIVMPVNGNLGNLGYVFIATAGAAIALSGLTGWLLCGLNGSVLTLGTLVAFLTLHKNFTRPVTQISNEINSIVMASAGSDRVYDLMDQKEEPDSGKVTLEKTGECQWCWKSADGQMVPLKGEVSLSDVDFSYVEGKQVLFDINLTAYPGQKIAFVGGTGAGKTTITNLINRFYEIQDGKITYDGFDVRDIQKDSLRKGLGIVLQETHLFTGTVLDNIRYGRLDATDRECMEAAKLVCADSFIRRLANGYNTVISGDGGNLSQGERQLLAIARAAVAAPPVLILDEATSSIDTRTEKLIQQGMDQLMKGRTTFVIAHRLSTILNADYIMVMDHGRIIERGKHNELLALKGKYYELFTGNQIV